MTQNIQINADRALELLAERVRDHEEFVYTKFPDAPTCRYEHNGCPSCLVGAVLFDAGVPIEVLRSFDVFRPYDEDEYSGAGKGIEELASEFPEWLQITDKALAILQRVQGRQDIGFTWANAFHEGIEAGINFGPERDEFEVRA